MRPTRKIIAEFIAVFLIGSVAGGFVTWYFTDNQLSTFMSKAAEKPDSMVARLDKKYSEEYHLTPEELDRIHPILVEMARQMYQIRHQFGADVITTVDKYHQEIADQLSPEHKAVYEAAMAERHKKLSMLLLTDQGSPLPGAK
jgi:uncharacterized membrane protein